MYIQQGPNLPIYLCHSGVLGWHEQRATIHGALQTPHCQQKDRIHGRDDKSRAQIICASYTAAQFEFDHSLYSQALKMLVAESRNCSSKERILLELTSQSSSCFAQSWITFASESVNGNALERRCSSMLLEEMKDHMVGKPRPVKWLRPTCIISVSLLKGSSAKLCSCRKDGSGAFRGIIGQERCKDACSKSII